MKTVVGTAEAISGQFKDYPVPHKYRRRTKNFKKKQRLFWLRMHLTAFMGTVQTQSIMAQPVPKFPNGGVINKPTSEECIIDPRTAGSSWKLLKLPDNLALGPNEDETYFL